MKKAVIITQAKDALSVVNSLRALGVLHVEHKQSPKSKDINSLQENLAIINQSLSILSGIKIISKNPLMHKKAVDGQLIARHIVDLYKRKEQLIEYLRVLSIRIKQYEEWGDFNPQDFSDLAQKNIFVGLYQIPVKQLNQLPANIAVHQLSVKGGIANCFLARDKIIDIGVKGVPLPQMGLAKMRERKELDSQVIRGLEQQMIDHVGYLDFFQKIKSDLLKELEFQEALSGMGQEEMFTYISGYIPFDSTEKLVAQARQEQWALRIDEPGSVDNIPVLLRNPAWVRIISPLFKFLEILPGYHELDISLTFLIFFSLFFGILIGDAGYGAVYFLITFFIHQRARKNKKKTSVFFLFYILSFCAIIWGLCTGTFFGQAWVLKAGYKPWIPALNDEKVVQRLCFFIGAVHLSIAHIWRAILKAPALTALADLGWGCVLWACFFIARVLILGDALPFFSNWLLIAGVTLVIIFTNPQRNILKGIGEGLGTLALSLMNNFTDVVSYIRLFAVGLAAVAISDAFNAMAISPGTGSISAILLTGCILLIGHSLGLILGPVSVLVHGVRLNVLEFSSHAGISWSGQNYKPLKT
ncbi:MAG: hypothetical protein Q7J37_03825 [Candidatus Omnitrophota bacterium]|nr:hypothetical protein [Candidatus Omnitrophota bacterium]